MRAAGRGGQELDRNGLTRGATVTSMARKRWSRVWKDDTRRTKRSATRGVDAPTDPAKAALRAGGSVWGWE